MSELTNNVLGHAARPKTGSRLANLGDNRAGNPAPTITGVTAVKAIKNAESSMELIIAGTGFRAPAVVEFSNEDVIVQEVEFVSGQELRVKVDLRDVTSNAQSDVTVINPDAQEDTLDDAITVTGPTAPGAIADLTIENTTDATVELSWSAPDDGGSAITGYRIQRRSPAGGGAYTTIVSNTGSTDTTYTNTGLTAETEYEYKVAAINAIGVGTYSTETSTTTEA